MSSDSICVTPLAQTGPLKERLHLWAECHLPVLEKKPPYASEDFPPNLSSRRQDLIEPLLQLADYIGGVWPVRIREALANIFQEEAAFDLKHCVQLLADVRDCFAHHSWPERLSTAALLAWLHNLSTRPWDVDGPITARTFARLLGAFDILPRLQRIGSAAPARGYQLADFVSHWQTHLGFDPALVTDKHQSEIVFPVAWRFLRGVGLLLPWHFSPSRQDGPSATGGLFASSGGPDVKSANSQLS